MPVRILLVGLNSGEPTEFDGKWLSEYDPTKQGFDSAGHPMIAHIKVTDRWEEALAFDDISDAIKLWRTEDGTRPDGKPNRPLTAFTADFVPDNAICQRH